MNRNIILAVFAALAALVAPFFVYPVLLMVILCFVIFASSFNLLLGYAGLLCFGHAMFFGTSAYITGHILKTTSISVEVSILAGMVFSAGMGLVVGLLAIRRQGIQFAMITLAISQFVYFLLLQSPFTGGENGMQGIPRNNLFGLIEVKDSFTFYYVILGFTVLAILAFYRIVHSPFGELLRAIRDNEPRVESLGFDTVHFKLIAFVLSAALAGLAGAMKATVFQFATLTDASWNISGEVILMTLLGGLGTFTGPMFGAAIIIVMNDLLAGLGEWALIAQGVVLLVVVIFFRRGFVGELAASDSAFALLRLPNRRRGLRGLITAGGRQAVECGALRSEIDLDRLVEGVRGLDGLCRLLQDGQVAIMVLANALGGATKAQGNGLVANADGQQDADGAAAGEGDILDRCISLALILRIRSIISGSLTRLPTSGVAILARRMMLSIRSSFIVDISNQPTADWVSGRNSPSFTWNRRA